MNVGYVISTALAAQSLQTDFQHSEPCQECPVAAPRVTRACEVYRYPSRGSASPILPLLAGLFALWLAFLLTLAVGA